MANCYLYIEEERNWQNLPLIQHDSILIRTLNFESKTLQHPDMNIDPATVIADENRIAAEIDFGGTHKGNLGDKPPTGKRFLIRGAFVLDFADDKICAFGTYYDPSIMLKQLGLMVV